jgi:hypothetical protein
MSIAEGAIDGHSLGDDVLGGCDSKDIRDLEKMPRCYHQV